MSKYFSSNNNYVLVRNIFIRTCIFFAGAYFVFHFLNGNISLNPLKDKRELVEINSSSSKRSSSSSFDLVSLKFFCVISISLHILSKLNIELSLVLAMVARP